MRQDERCHKDLFRIRTVTVFLQLRPVDFQEGGETIAPKIAKAAACAKAAETALQTQGYSVQTIRLATNPFGEWLTADDSKVTAIEKRLAVLDALLAGQGIEMCALGPAQALEEMPICVQIVAASHRFSCSAHVSSTDVAASQAVAGCILQIASAGSGADECPAHLVGGLGNFRFCAVTACPAFIPFFPASKSASLPAGSDSEAHDNIHFAVGLENGKLAKHLLGQCQSITNIPTIFPEGFTQALLPIQECCLSLQEATGATFVGIDTSLNPSLEATGSVASAIECLDEVTTFGGPGTVAAAAAITIALQSLPGIQRTGYCGLMLPLCEDERLAELTTVTGRCLRVSDLLSVSHVCGVGIDTVPLPGSLAKSDLASLILDVAAVADRWNKPLSCRVFPVPGKEAGEWTTFDSPYMVNARIMDLV